MKNKIILLIALPALAMNVYSQGGKSTVSVERRASAPYHHIHISGEMNVKLVQNEVPGLIVEGTSYQTGNTVSMLRNDTLFLYQTNIRRGQNKTLVSINVDDLVSLVVVGKTKVDCTGLVNTDYLTIRATAGAQMIR